MTPDQIEVLYSTHPDALAIRKIMADLGWDSDDRITKSGWGHDHGYSVWFYRWNWHGRACDRQSFVAGVHSIEPSEMSKAVQRAAQIARSAWAKYPTDLVYQDGSGFRISHIKWSDLRELKKEDKHA